MLGIAKNPLRNLLRTFIGSNCLKNKNGKAWPKKEVLIKKESRQIDAVFKNVKWHLSKIYSPTAFSLGT